MKVCFKNFSQFFTIFCITLLLSACGGSDKTKNYTINADVSTINFSNEIITEFEHSITVNVTFDGDGLLVGYAPDSEPVGWLNFRTENLTANSATIYIDLTQADQINIGEYLTKLRFSTGELNDNNTTKTIIKGSEIKAIKNQDFSSPNILRAAKKVLRLSIEHHLDGKELNSKKVFQSITAKK